MDTEEILSRPYARRLTPDPSGGYVATIQEFDGLIAEGETADEALVNLDAAAKSWIEATLESGGRIPAPVDLGGYSGRVALRIPRGLHKRAVEMACAEGTSVNQWLVSAVGHYLGSHDGFNATIDRALLKVRVTQTASNYFQTNLFQVLHLSPDVVVIQDSWRMQDLVTAANVAKPVIAPAALPVIGAGHG